MTTLTLKGNAAPNYEDSTDASTKSILVFIGRFQFMHVGHVSVINNALSRCDVLILGVGSANASRSPRDPLTYEERYRMIYMHFADLIDAGRIKIVPIDDFLYNETKWIENVQRVVINAAREVSPNYSISLVGCEKKGDDKKSYFFKRFPSWKNNSVGISEIKGVSSTAIRNAIFTGSDLPANMVTEATQRFFADWKNTLAYKYVREEHGFYDAYKAPYKELRYPPTFQTVDAVVIQSGHVLMVRRKASPGKGLMALPGGFIKPDEYLLDAAIRELKEETKLDIPEKVLRQCVVVSRRYDDPHRSARGRTITEAFLIRPEDRDSFPKVKGSSDAASAFWVPLGALDPRECFEDHWHIIDDLKGLL